MIIFLQQILPDKHYQRRIRSHRILQIMEKKTTGKQKNATKKKIPEWKKFDSLENTPKELFADMLHTLSGALPSDRDYWSDAEDPGVQLVKNAMSRNRYSGLKSFYICKKCKGNLK
ncbi:hypothetical protein JTB14_022672 [Gonioctena quinquepunctata]|nr:hypothetical protein JTB14_022672 [Gonioctena quinquepunctata]